MAQRVVFEISESNSLDQHTADQLTDYIQQLAASNTSLSTFHLEIESDTALTVVSGGMATESEATDVTGESRAEVVEDQGEAPPGDDGEDDEMRLNPGTRRWTLASILYHSPDPLSVRDTVELSEGEDWEMNQSQSSSELYNMHQDGLVHREGQPYEYSLTETGEEQLVQRSRTESTPIEPNPFETE